MNDRDIILIIENWINEQKKEHFIVNFKELDSILSLPDGSTERNIKVAADTAFSIEDSYFLKFCGMIKIPFCIIKGNDIKGFFQNF